MKVLLRKKVIVAIGVVFVATLWFAGCGESSSTGSGVDPAVSLDGGPATTNMSLKMVDTAPGASVVKSLDATDVGGGTITVGSARAVVKRVELELPDGESCSDVSFELVDCSCNDTSSSTDVVGSSISGDASDIDEIFFSGPFIVDLMTGTSVPPLELIIPSGVYHELQLKLVPLDPLSTMLPAGDILLGNSMVIEASYDVAGETTKRFRIILSFDHEIKFESDAGLTISEASPVNGLILGLNVNSWFTGIDIGACFASGAATQDADGVFIIDSSITNDACHFLGKLKDNVESSSLISESPDDTADDS